MANVEINSDELDALKNLEEICRAYAHKPGNLIEALRRIDSGISARRYR